MCIDPVGLYLWMRPHEQRNAFLFTMKQCELPMPSSMDDKMKEQIRGIMSKRDPMKALDEQWMSNSHVPREGFSHTASNMVEDAIKEFSLQSGCQNELGCQNLGCLLSFRTTVG